MSETTITDVNDEAATVEPKRYVTGDIIIVDGEYHWAPNSVCKVLTQYNEDYNRRQELYVEVVTQGTDGVSPGNTFYIYDTSVKEATTETLMDRLRETTAQLDAAKSREALAGVEFEQWQRKVIEKMTPRVNDGTICLEGTNAYLRDIDYGAFVKDGTVRAEVKFEFNTEQARDIKYQITNGYGLTAFREAIAKIVNDQMGEGTLTPEQITVTQYSAEGTTEWKHSLDAEQVAVARGDN